MNNRSTPQSLETGKGRTGASPYQRRVLLLGDNLVVPAHGVDFGLLAR